MTVRRSVRPPFQPPSLPTMRGEGGILLGPDPMRLNRPMVAQLVAGLRGRHLLIVDVTAIVAAAYVALALRDDSLLSLERVGPYLPILAILLAARIGSNMHFGLYSRGWRFASVPDLVRIVGAVLLGSVIAVACVYSITVMTGGSLTESFPRSFWIGEMLLTVAALGGVRFGIRATSEWIPRTSPIAVVDRRATLLYGAGRTGVLMARSAQRRSPTTW